MDYKDFAREATNWDRTPKIGGTDVATNLDTPIACCITIPTTHGDVTCAQSPLTSATSNFNKVIL